MKFREIHLSFVAKEISFVVNKLNFVIRRILVICMGGTNKSDPRPIGYIVTSTMLFSHFLGET